MQTVQAGPGAPGDHRQQLGGAGRGRVRGLQLHPGQLGGGAAAAAGGGAAAAAGGGGGGEVQGEPELLPVGALPPRLPGAALPPPQQGGYQGQCPRGTVTRRYCVWCLVPEGVAGSGGGEDGGDRGGRVQGLQGDQRGREGEGEGQHHQVHPRPEQDQWAQGSYLVTFSVSVVQSPEVTS